MGGGGKVQLSTPHIQSVKCTCVNCGCRPIVKVKPNTEFHKSNLSNHGPMELETTNNANLIRHSTPALHDRRGQRTFAKETHFSLGPVR